MNSNRDAVETSYKFCRWMSRRAGSNFYVGFLLLPAEKRRAMEALYAFMRHTDDLADALPTATPRRDALAAWRAALEGAINAPELRHRGEPLANPRQRSPGALVSVMNPSVGDRILPALADAVQRFQIPREHLHAVIDGVKMDLNRWRYETFDELQRYCQLVASAVGLACIHVWGFRGPEAFEPARQAGTAMQLTNILRDLKEDAQAGRVYLPMADLRQCGYSIDDLLAGADDQRFHRLMAMEIARAEQFYRGGAKLWEWLEPDGRRIFGLMMTTYQALLRKIACQPAVVFRRHVRLSQAKKLQLVARWWLWPPRQLGKGRGTRDEGRGLGTSVPSEATLSQKEKEPAPSTVAIIGGGLAGLAAAVAAAERGLRVELFEQTKSLGGRAGSFVDSETGKLVDYCQHVAMGCCTDFLDFCRYTGVMDCFECTGTLHFIGPEGGQYDFTPSRWLPAPLHLLPALMGLKYLSWGERLGIFCTLRRLVSLPRSSRLHRTPPRCNGEDLTMGVQENDAVELDAETIGTWLRCQGQSRRAIEHFWSVVLVSALSETVDHTSLAAAQKVFSDGFLASRGASKLVLPLRPLAEIFHDRVGKWLADHGVSVHLGTPVRKIEGDRRRADAIVLADGARREFDFVIVAVAWRNLRALLSENLSASMPELAHLDQIEPAAITAVHLWFDRPVVPLPHAVLVGRLSQWVFAKDCDTGASPAPQYCQVVISASHRLARREHDDLLVEVRRELEALWPDTRAARLLHGRVIVQPAAVFSVQPGLDRFRPRQQTSIENLALAGDWTATGWPATMEGAVRSGRQAAEVFYLPRPAPNHSI